MVGMLTDMEVLYPLFVVGHVSLYPVPQRVKFIRAELAIHAAPFNSVFARRFTDDEPISG